MFCSCAFRHRAQQQADGPLRADQAQHRSQRRQQQAPPSTNCDNIFPRLAPSATRTANSCASNRPRHQQIRHVRARDQQHKSYCPQEDQAAAVLQWLAVIQRTIGSVFVASRYFLPPTQLLSSWGSRIVLLIACANVSEFC